MNKKILVGSLIGLLLVMVVYAMPSIVLNDALVGTLAWNNPEQVQVSNNLYSWIYMPKLSTTNYIKALDWNLNIPFDAIITGVEATVERRLNKRVLVKDFSVKLVKNGVISGNDKSKPSYYSIYDTKIKYGGINDTWGLSLTPTDINSGDFGFVYSAKRFDNLETYNLILIDWMNLTVYYKFPDYCKLAGFNNLGDLELDPSSEPEGSAWCNTFPTKDECLSFANEDICSWGQCSGLSACRNLSEFNCVRTISCNWVDG